MAKALDFLSSTNCDNNSRFCLLQSVCSNLLMSSKPWRDFLVARNQVLKLLPFGRFKLLIWRTNLQAAFSLEIVKYSTGNLNFLLVFFLLRLNTPNESPMVKHILN